MYEIVQIGSIFDARLDMLVNPVNCIGLDNKGLALEFKHRYRSNSRAYQRACHNHQIRPGLPHLWPTGQDVPPRYICNFPTKDHWQDPSTIKMIEEGLYVMDRAMSALQITSVAVPALGCGLGGLSWEEVEPLIRKHLDRPDRETRVYPPMNEGESPDVEQPTVRLPSLAPPLPGAIRD
jgi:O-acetyl-ADP-ribose deacetylase (regulator of RNase III)